MRTEIPIIVINYGDYATRYLSDFLKSLEQVTDVEWRLFVIDNESTEYSRNLITSVAPTAEVIPLEKNYGYSAYSYVIDDIIGRGYEYVLISNMDMEVESDFLLKLVSVLKSDESIAAVQPRIMLFEDKKKINSMGNIIHYAGFGYSVGGYESWEHYKDNYRAPQQVCYGSGASLLVRSSVIQKIGLFDKDFFMYHEDLDFGWRLILSGSKTFIVPDSVVYHKYKFAKSMLQYYWMERNRFVCLGKNYKALTLLVFFPMIVAIEIGLFIFSLFSGFWKEKLKVYGYLLKPSTWKRILKGRGKTQSLRKISDREVLKWFTPVINAQQVSNPFVTYILNPISTIYFTVIRFIVFW